MEQPDFDFFLGGIEDAILQKLEAAMKDALGVKKFALYSGELSDPTQLKAAIAALTPQFPLVMVSYADGEDTDLLKTPSVKGEPNVYRHDCTFVVICASNDARGIEAQRRGKAGVYKMLAAVRKHLSGLIIKANYQADENSPSVPVQLTLTPLKPLANEFIARLPNMTAYAVPFETYFKWSTVDRTEAGIAVSEIILNVESLNTSSGQSEHTPGVTFNL
jgi:hypothetical protein